MSRPIPQQAVELVSRFEGYRNSAYPDPGTGGEPWTIGYGHTGGVKKGDKCTTAQALGWLASDLQIAARKLEGVLKPDAIRRLNDAQWSALLSFAYNLGAKPSWTIWSLINAGELDQAANEFSRFINANGKPFKGLIARRSAEFELWHSMDAAPEEETPPSAVTREPGATPPTSAVDKPLVQSKTIWAGGIAAAGGLAQGAQQVQVLVAPQAQNNELLQKLAGFVAVVIVAAGVAIVVFKALEQRAKARQ